MKQISLYHNTFGYAKEHDELEEFRASHRANIACKNAIERAIRQNFDGLHLAEGAEDPVIAQFGLERVAYVLANTVQQKDLDGRFSTRNKAWAKDIPIVEDKAFDRRLDFIVESHPAVLDGFINCIRKKQLEQVQETNEQAKKPALADQIENAESQKKRPEKGSVVRELEK